MADTSRARRFVHGRALRTVSVAVLTAALMVWDVMPAEAAMNYLFAGQHHPHYDGQTDNGVGGYIRASVIANMNNGSDHLDEYLRLDCNCSDGYVFDTTWVETGRVQGFLKSGYSYPHSAPMYYEYNYCADRNAGSGWYTPSLGNPPSSDVSGYPQYIEYYPATVLETCNGNSITVQKFAIAVGSPSNIVAYGLYHGFSGSQTALYASAYQEIAYCTGCQAEQIGQDRWGLDANGNSSSTYNLKLDSNGSWSNWTASNSPGTYSYANSPLYYCNNSGAGLPL